MKPSKVYFLSNCDRYAITRALADLDRRRGHFVGLFEVNGRPIVRTVELPKGKSDAHVRS